MKTMRFRYWIGAILLGVMLAFLSVDDIYAANGNTVNASSLTEKSVYNAMMAMKSEYPEGRSWTNDDMYMTTVQYSDGRVFTMKAYGCAGFAWILSDAAFGELPITAQDNRVDAIRVGDILRLYNDTHSVIVLEVKPESVIVAEGNYAYTIHWGREIPLSEIENDPKFYRQSRWPVEVVKPAPKPVAPNPTAHEKVVAFVDRMYNLVLGRKADPVGRDNWVSCLESQTSTGAEVASGFFMSKELIGKNLSDEEYVRLCYSAILGRGADETGMEGWLTVLRDGFSRLYVLRGFAESQEFQQICDSYGVIRGGLAVTEPRDKNMGVTQFVSRCYLKALGRQYDVSGLNNWCDAILTGRSTSKQVASNGFFHSDEFQKKHLSDTEYVKVLYRTFLDREYDAPGLEDWVSSLRRGASRDEVMNGFADSVEFRELMQRYGL